MSTSFQPNGIITLLTDFGTQDAYVGAMKGVILSHHDQLRIHDLSHEIPAQNIRHGAFVLKDLLPWFPAGTVHCCVIDPGVGSSRSALILQIRDQLVVAPDNGLISWTGYQPTDPIYEIPMPQGEKATKLSSTFHGRDLFAPMAAALASGAQKLNQLSLLPELPVHISWPDPQKQSETVFKGEVVCIDSFGNCITNITEEDFKNVKRVEVKSNVSVSIRCVQTYSDADDGDFIALIGSSGLMEISSVNSNAAKKLNLGCTSEIKLLC
tara:strand:- start:11024 stop:11824 length:801 start_codon:yes stop_codon:yes gene_type:complete